MSVEDLYPPIRPTLDLNFARSKSVDPRITFSRASAATYYDGRTVAKAEENLLTYSQDFDNAAWARSASTIVANVAVAPDGTVSADLFNADGTNGAHHVSQYGLAVAGGFTTSVYAKAGTNNFLQIFVQADGVPYANFDLLNGVVGNVASGSTATITSVGNGWYRCTLSHTSSTASYPAFAIVTGTTAARAEGNTLTSGVYLWGAQRENRSSATAYTPTTTQPITNYIPVLQTAFPGVPRIDHDPVTGECKGLLIEEQRTNLLLRSQDFITANWLGTGSGVAVSCIAPDGSLSGHKLSEDLTSGVHYRYQGLANVSGTTTYTLSAYVKAAGRSRVQLWSASGSPRFSARFDLASKTATGLPNVGGAVLLASTIEAVGNDWFRVSITGTTGADNILGLHLFLDNGSSHFYQGDGYSGIYIWGAQVELGAFPASYIKTEASQVTRAADSASMIGANFSSWYRQDEGTLFAEYVQGPSQLNQAVFSVGNNNSTNQITLYNDSQVTANLVPTFVVNSNGTTHAFISYAAPSNPSNKISGAYAFNNFGSSMNGSITVADSMGEVPTVDQAWIGRTVAANITNGHIKRLTYYPKRLTDAQLQALTT